MDPAVSRLPDARIHLAELPNGVRVLTLPLPHAHTACASVFVQAGSAHEPKALAGISHVIEHMAFKGTAARDARRINLDAERLGAEVNAHTDKDHTAYQMRGLPADVPALLAMLGDIVLHSEFPEAELERERQVILQEFAEVEDDPMATAYQLFDRACWGLHPAAQPVIGQRRVIERLERAQLLGYVQRQYRGVNIVVGVAGDVDPAEVVRAAEAAFGGVEPGSPNLVEAPAWHGGVRSRRIDGIGQAHLLFGFGLPALGEGDAAAEVAAAVFGEGMSSPLLERLREQQGLVYHATAAADLFGHGGQFVVEASSAPDRLGQLVDEVALLVARHADRIDPTDLERARRQVKVRRLQAEERPMRRLEELALDLFAHGRARPGSELIEQAAATDAAAVRGVFERMVAAGAAVALVGPLGRAAGERAREAVAARLGPGQAGGLPD
jgi:predicted Zn-dependent peptidase